MRLLDFVKRQLLKVIWADFDIRHVKSLVWFLPSRWKSFLWRYVIWWMKPQTFINRILVIKSHRDFHNCLLIGSASKASSRGTDMSRALSTCKHAKPSYEDRSEAIGSHTRWRCYGDSIRGRFDEIATDKHPCKAFWTPWWFVVRILARKFYYGLLPYSITFLRCWQLFFFSQKTS